eukprot:gb/GEZN01000902.1/.p1 GENE.gb/GEZN01000902.1/~~gb/GEZN01000902.1/.p1  ORF type:complete len:1126 (+),score=235.22 gb/GEZN01000902.1/:95-3472(+)
MATKRISKQTEESIEYARDQLRKFIKNMQPKLRSNQKETLSKFYQYFTKYHPDYEEKDIEFLLCGNADLKGLLQCCGNTNLKSQKANTVKKSAAQALLFLKLLLKPEENVHYEKYLAVLPKIPIRAIQAMKLEKHVLLPDGSAEDAFWIIKIFSENITEHPKELYVTHQALIRYDDWLNRAQEAHDGGSDDDDDDEGNEHEAKRWADIGELSDPELEEDAQGLAVADDSTQAEDTFMDPLGLHGNLDRKVKQFNTQKRKQLKKRKNDEGAILLDPTAFEGSIHTSAKDFNAILFLTETHKDTPYADLKRGLVTLQQAVKNKSGDVQQLVREHFAQYVSCKDTIERIHLTIKSEVSSTDPGKAGRLLSQLSKIEAMSRDGYKELLERKQKADKARSVLAVLEKWRFLFDLPGQIHQNILDEEYSKVVHDYKRAMALKIDAKANGGPSLNLPAQVVEHIKQQIAAFRQQLFAKLRNPQARVEEQQRVIAHLMELDCQTDPAWFYLQRQKDWICSMLDRCFEDHETRSGAKEMDVLSMSFSYQPAELQPPGLTQAITDHTSLSQLVRELCSTLVKNVPEFFKLAQTVASGKLLKVTGGVEVDGSLRDTGMSGTSAPGALPLSPQGEQQRVENLVSSIFNKFMAHIRYAIFPSEHPFAKSVALSPSQDTKDALTTITNKPHVDLKQTESKGIVPFTKSNGLTIHADKTEQTDKAGKTDKTPSSTSLTAVDGPLQVEQKLVSGFRALPPSSLMNVRLLLRSIQTIKELAMPPAYSEGLQQLADHVVKYWVTQSFTNTLIDISDLHNQEDWVVVQEEPALTRFPQRFHEQMEIAFASIDALTRPYTKAQVELITAPFLECLCAGADCLHALAEGLSSQESTAAPSAGLASSHVLTKRLLAVYNNAVFTNQQILPDLVRKYQQIMPKFAHNALNQPLRKVRNLYVTLEDLLLQRFIRLKTLRCGSVLREGICRGGAIHDQEPQELTEVRPYVLELLITLVGVHNEITSLKVSPEVRAQCVKGILEGVASTFEDCVKELDTIHTYDALQILIETEFVRKSLAAFVTEEADRIFQSIQQLLERIVGQNFNEVRWRQIRVSVISATDQTCYFVLKCFEPSKTREVGPGGGVTSGD